MDLKDIFNKGMAGVAEVSANGKVKVQLKEIDQRIKATEEEKSNAFLELGKKFYEDCVEKPEYAPEYADLIFTIRDCEERIRKDEALKLKEQGLRRCENCGSILVFESNFCNICGKRIDKSEENILEVEAAEYETIETSGEEEPLPEITFEIPSDFIQK